MLKCIRIRIVVSLFMKGFQNDLALDLAYEDDVLRKKKYFTTSLFVVARAVPRLSEF